MVKRIISIVVVLVISSFYLYSQTVSVATGRWGGYEYVDLGLKSGTLWATCNLDAKSPSETGGFYAWGETSPKTSFFWDNYKYGNDTVFTKYNIFEKGGVRDNLQTLEPQDDAARQRMGTGWRVPLKVEVDELMSDCQWSRYALNKVNGYLVTGPNGNSIFIPDCGAYEGAQYKEEDFAMYWTADLVETIYPSNTEEIILGISTIAPRKAYAFAARNMYVMPLRKEAACIRPVLSPDIVPVDFSDILNYCYGDMADSYYKSYYIYKSYNKYFAKKLFWVGIKPEELGPFKNLSQAKKRIDAVQPWTHSIQEEEAYKLRKIGLSKMLQSLHKSYSYGLTTVKRNVGETFYKYVKYNEVNGVVSLKGDFILPVAYREDLDSWAKVEDIIYDGIDRADSVAMYKRFVDNFVKTNKAFWEHKAEYETSEEYRRRMSYPYYNMAMGYYMGEAMILFGDIYGYTIMDVGRYDRDNETYLMKTLYGSIPLYVCAYYAGKFRNSVSRHQCYIDEILFDYSFGSYKMKSIRIVEFSSMLNKRNNAYYDYYDNQSRGYDCYSDNDYILLNLGQEKPAVKGFLGRTDSSQGYSYNYWYFYVLPTNRYILVSRYEGNSTMQYRP